MEKRKWLWKRKPSDKSPGETESSGSLSSHSERYSDEQLEQDALKEFSDHDKQSPEITSKAATIDDEAKESLRSLTEKLSAALVNVSAKEDLVKQHAKVAEEAIAGWEKAESEVAVVKQQLDAAVQQNLSLEVRVSHLDGALKECVRQLRQARDEQEKRIQEAVVEKNEWESEKAALENQLLKLQSQVETCKAETPTSTDPDILVRLDCLEKENTALKIELHSCSEELEIRTIERDLSTQAAESASKQHLESIKKVTKLEAECRKLQATARKASPFSDQRSSAVSSYYVESVTDSQSDSGERLNTVDNDGLKMTKLETNEYEPSCSNSWASALIAELDQFKNEKATHKTLAACSIEIDMMDDFLEMERLAALSETANKTPSITSDAVPHDSPNVENPLAAEYDSISQRVAELEQKLEKIEAEKAELENALSECQDALKVSSVHLKESQTRLEELQKELDAVNESKELLEFQLFGMEVEARTMSANIGSLKTEIEREQSLSSDMEAKCRELENELQKKDQKVELQQTFGSNGEVKIKQEDLAVAADKLAECQKTIASLGKQLQSLATLEDFLIDTANLPGGESVVAKAGGELWKLHVNETFTPKCGSDPSKVEEENASHSMNGNEGESSASSSTSSATQATTAKSKNGFGKLFSRSKSGLPTLKVNDDK
ncbi:filament-like plant protein isoform X1 [Nicotiana tabacum]|uniref:Filament-like plant protein isoform X1 n=2 Tax=Nicotiana TaxID=4085 RepID=A0A1S4B9E4_TOBAC|nr:PREDICTED: filament-like plant protein isoform X1 [Nicotiana sylvestris]XP_009774513.1 PREDICTED: filament-like plant protein isoform X1 [Nicotiana sylvestris]XP_016485515.1 PREDICTED: filament-like plant protein isoform X1 [Nicotiana tabacum]XP_016485516.1 PREDICTED: filament-like plant protein isoform X1 [Nicotiana tabacum]